MIVERKLELYHLQGALKQGWYQTLIRIEVQRKYLQNKLYSFLRPNFRQWHRKLISADIWRNKMSRSGASSGAASENGSNIDETNHHNTDLYVDVKPTQWPIVYGPEYNIGFLGLERLHPFDAGKWGKVYNFLKEDGMIRDDTTVRPKEATEEDLLVVHSKKYINSLRWSMEVAAITEVPPVAILPNFIVQRKVLRPFRYQTGGTILAAKLAMDRGWGINLGGGFHHCSKERGGGFCAYADITLAIRFLFERNPNVKKAMIIDLDAHQGNGHERDFMDDSNVYIMDVYNRNIYPHDGFAKRGIKRRVELSSLTGDDEYLELVKNNVEDALEEFTPDIIVYNAGTDVLEGDPLGHLRITPGGIIARDQIVFEKARSSNIPIMMVTSGGYQRTTARIIADSIQNLRKLKLISCDEAENAPAPEPVPENQSGLGLPRSQSESGLFAKIRNFCLSKSPTREKIPSPSNSNILNILKLPSVKSTSDLNLPAQTSSEWINDEKAISFVGEKVIEKFEIDFMTKKIDSMEVLKDVIPRKFMSPDLSDPLSANNGCDPKTNVLAKDLMTISSDKFNDDKGARPKISGVSDPTVKWLESEDESIRIDDTKVKSKMDSDQNVKIQQNEISVILDIGKNGDANQDISIALKPDELVDDLAKTEQRFSERVSFSKGFDTKFNEEISSVDVLNNNLRVTSAGEITVVTPDSGEDKISGNIEGSSGGEASDDEWSDFVVYNSDKNCDRNNGHW